MEQRPARFDATAPGTAATPRAAGLVFADRLAIAERYVAHLASTGVGHGLIGPREVPRLWERHVLNCAVLTDLLPAGAQVADIGSGAGLPGLCLAIRRPDVQVVLIEPLLRRCTWLRTVVADLGLADRVEIRRGRAQEVSADLQVPFVTARAVASLDKLLAWTLPLLAPAGSLLAIKGRTAQAELDGVQPGLARLGVAARVLRVGGEVLAEPTMVVRVDRSAGAEPPQPMPVWSTPSASPRRGRARRPG